MMRQYKNRLTCKYKSILQRNNIQYVLAYKRVGPVLSIWCQIFKINRTKLVNYFELEIKIQLDKF